MKAKYVVLGVLIGLALGLAIFGVPASAQSSTPTCVGVGVTNPTEKLEVDGKIKAKGLIVDGNVNITGSNANLTINNFPAFVECNWEGRTVYYDDGQANDFGLICRDGRIIKWCHYSGNPSSRGLSTNVYNC